MARVTRAAIAFREGLPVAVRDGRITVLARAVETLDADTLREMRDGLLLLTHPRAETLKIRLYTPDVVAIPLDAEATPDRLRAIADPTFDLAEPMKGPFSAVREKLPGGFAASVKLAKLAGLLPATVAKRSREIPDDLAIVSAEDIRDFEQESVNTLSLVTRARVPLEGAEQTEVAAFRARDGGPEHYAIVIGQPSPHEPVLVRLHSECFTGDLLGSLKCDCGEQLRGAIAAIAKAGGGVLLYLAQEGRGIGLINKLRAYRLQDQGFDTLEANRRLGFEEDERLYGIAAKMLSLLGYKSVRVLTNNPAKVEALRTAGIDVVERVPHRFAATSHNREYLKTKAKAGHLL
ncbi:MAG TPA: GTP cyclohydrolase II [Rhizomicrobium sp.]